VEDFLKALNLLIHIIIIIIIIIIAAAAAAAVSIKSVYSELGN